MLLRLLSTLLVTSVALTAQSPLTTTFANNNAGSVGGGVYFNLTANDPAGISLCQIAVNLSSAAGTAGTIDIYVVPTTSVPHTQFATAVPVASASVVAAGPGQPSVLGALSAPIFIPTGTTVGVAYRAFGVAFTYTNGTAVYPVPGNIFGAGQQLQANAGQASNVFGAGTAFSPRMVNTRIDYLAGNVACPPPASVVSQGAGCVAAFASFYELFANPVAFDLAGSCITLTNSPSGYTVSSGGTFNAIGSTGGTPGNLALTDDSAVAAGTLGLTVGSNCWVQTGVGTNSLAFNPTAALVLANPATAFYSWQDLNPAIVGSGPVVYEEFGTLAQITYDGTWRFGGTTAADAVNVQFQIDTATGNCVICWGVMTVLGTNPHLVGYSPGGPSTNPGNRDLSATLPFSTGAVDILPLTLTGIGRPVQGAASVNYQVTTNNIPASVLSHVGIVGITNPTRILDPFGMVGCVGYADPDIIIFDLAPAPVTSPSYTWTALTLPAGAPFFFGFEFYAQGAIFGTTVNNAFGLGAQTSNGLKCTIGGI